MYGITKGDNARTRICNWVPPTLLCIRSEVSTNRCARGIGSIKRLGGVRRLGGHRLPEALLKVKRAPKKIVPAGNVGDGGREGGGREKKFPIIPHFMLNIIHFLAK